VSTAAESWCGVVGGLRAGLPLPLPSRLTLLCCDCLAAGTHGAQLEAEYRQTRSGPSLRGSGSPVEAEWFDKRKK
jgi:hypothetical protein